MTPHARIALLATWLFLGNIQCDQRQLLGRLDVCRLPAVTFGVGVAHLHGPVDETQRGKHWCGLYREVEGPDLREGGLWTMGIMR